MNDNAPTFDKPEYSIALPEELPIGTPVLLDFQATDRDQEGPNSFVKYRIVDEQENSQLLKIPDPYRPLIVVGGRIDYERLKNFTVDLEAEDGGAIAQKSVVKLRVEVRDVDDLNPVFRHENYYTNSIQVWWEGEGTCPQEFQDSVFEVFPEPIFAKDGDSLNESIHYELSGGKTYLKKISIKSADYNEYYSINSSGIVRLVKDTVISTILFVHVSF